MEGWWLRIEMTLSLLIIKIKHALLMQNVLFGHMGLVFAMFAVSFSGVRFVGAFCEEQD